MHGRACRKASSEMAGNRSERMIVDMEGVSGANLDHSGKRTSQNKLAGLKPDIEAGKLVGKPGNPVGRVVEYRSGNTDGS